MDDVVCEFACLGIPERTNEPTLKQVSLDERGSPKSDTVASDRRLNSCG
jgi:hypothetical protein